MKIKYLGTGAAERVPAIFCNCKICRNAREVGGREIRTQTQFIIDDRLLIDFPGDSYLHLLKYKIDFSKFNNLLLTHWHSDHLYAEDIAYRMSNYANNVDNLLNVYGNETVQDFYNRAFELEERTDKKRIMYHMIKPYQKFKIDVYTVFPLPAQHGKFQEDCFIYAINDGKNTFLDTHDTGYPTLEMFNYLEKNNLVFSLVSIDCTGQVDESVAPHMNWKEALKFIEELKKRNLITLETKFVINHFSHNGGLTYEEMSKISEKHGIITSYDGLEIFV
ncbi:MBL fold metallo-hydrolase [Pediococcus pentosaceus]|jgi:phosphoribosyl 1,2-cyclic phosphate phosphodiesterase|uniref:MBL fold metallo-hydrolase n=1 Tax=Pediococcus pentosaceus TaxID=1255 RepID=UPI002658B1A5|nr:MBL fold metallo-hydrolase [Pediococcus pentosaceus]WKF71251.1 MBL fold metallo-hydrolase [Pediococcus pentosaceus]